MVGFGLALAYVAPFQSAKTCFYLGTAFLALGTLLNRVVVHANGGRMPVRIKPDHPHQAALLDSSRHQPLAPGMRLKFLADIIHVCNNGRERFHVVSVGDLLIYTALAIFVTAQWLLILAYFGLHIS